MNDPLTTHTQTRAEALAPRAAQAHVRLLREDDVPIDIPPGRIELLGATRADRRTAVDALLASRDFGAALAYLERVLADCLIWPDSEPRTRRAWFRRNRRGRQRWRPGRPTATVR